MDIAAKYCRADTSPMYCCGRRSPENTFFGVNFSSDRLRESGYRVVRFHISILRVERWQAWKEQLDAKKFTIWLTDQPYRTRRRHIYFAGLTILN